MLSSIQENSKHSVKDGSSWGFSKSLQYILVLTSEKVENLKRNQNITFVTDKDQTIEDSFGLLPKWACKLNLKSR